MKWRSVGVLAAVALIVMMSFGIRVNAETVTWSNPTTYIDNTSISPTNAAQLRTNLQYRIGAGSWTAFGTATGGASTLVAPYVTPGGGTSYWRAQTVSPLDNNATSAWSPEYTYVRPFQVPGAGQVLGVQ